VVWTVSISKLKISPALIAEVLITGGVAAVLDDFSESSIVIGVERIDVPALLISIVARFVVPATSTKAPTSVIVPVKGNSKSPPTEVETVWEVPLSNIL